MTAATDEDGLRSVEHSGEVYPNHPAYTGRDTQEFREGKESQYAGVS